MPDASYMRCEGWRGTSVMRNKLSRCCIGTNPLAIVYAGKAAKVLIVQFLFVEWKFRAKCARTISFKTPSHSAVLNVKGSR